VVAEFAVNESQPIEIPIEPRDGQLDSILDLEKLADAYQFSLPTGATVGLVIAAQDHFDLGGQTHVGRGQPIQLSIVTEDQLLVLLDRQELEMRQRLELIISELEQLRETVHALNLELAPPANADGRARADQPATV